MVDVSENLSEISVVSLQGESYPLSRYQGSVLLIVNTASACGFTPQFAGLEELHRKYADQGLVVLGFPCNQFGKQEPGSSEEIATFCQKNYGVSFPMHEKIAVNGSDEHPLYHALKHAAPGILGTNGIKWNFTKFLVDRSGTKIKRFAPNDEPKKMEAEIVELLAESASAS